MKVYRLSGITLVALMTLYGANAMANHSVEVGLLELYHKTHLLKGKAHRPSQYRGARITAGLRMINDGDANDPNNYELQVINLHGKTTGKLHGNGFKGNLERNAPFQPSSGKIVGLYVPEAAYKGDDRSARYPAELVPAKNVTHVFYSSFGICDYDQDRPSSVTLKASHNLRVQDNTDQRLLKWECHGKGDFNVTKFGSVRSFYMLDAMNLMKVANPDLKTIVSIGGNQLSSPFHSMVETEEGREIFVKSVIELMTENPVIDGIDLAWEFVGGNPLANQPTVMERVIDEPPPSAELAPHGYKAEKARYTLLIKALRKALDQNFTGKQRKTLSAAVSAEPAKLAAIDLEALKDDFDFVNVMSYGLSGAWARYPTHQVGTHAKPLTSAYASAAGWLKVKDETGKLIELKGKPGVSYYRDMWLNTSAQGAIETILLNYPNFPRKKLVIGAATQSRGWHSVRVKPEHDKLFWYGVATGELGQSGVAGTFKNGSSDFREVYDEYMRDENTTGNTPHLYYDKQAQAAYTWVPKGMEDGYQVAQVESFDDPRSVLAKGELVKQYQLGGLFGENASADNGLIVNAMNAAMCNRTANGEYYTFSQRYAGEVDTAVLKKRGHAAVTVRETLSEPTTFDFDEAAARALCEDTDIHPTVKITNTVLQETSPGWYSTELSAQVTGKDIDPRKLTYKWTVILASGSTEAERPKLNGTGPTVTLAINQRAHDQTVVVRVEVSGPGIRGILSQKYGVILLKKPQP